MLPWCGLPRYYAVMKVDKLSISFEPGLGDAVRSAAARAGKPVSSWLAEAAASKLRADALTEFLASWETEHGVLSAEEIARAEAELGLAAGDTAA
jgi:citrate lyase beta subunit